MDASSFFGQLLLFLVVYAATLLCAWALCAICNLYVLLATSKVEVKATVDESA